MDLLGLALFGIPRVDACASWAGRVDPKLARPAPPPLGSTIVQPPPPNPRPPEQAPAPWGGPNAQPLPHLKANGSAQIPAPNDAEVSAKPPKLPKRIQKKKPAAHPRQGSSIEVLLDD